MDLCRTSLFCEKLSHLIIVQKTKRLLGLLMTDYKKNIYMIGQSNRRRDEKEKYYVQYS